MGETFQSHLSDPYNGIFYTITDNEDDTTIQFISSLFFNLFLRKMQADFQLPTDVHVYKLNTRKQKVKCHIVLNAISKSILISEGGHKAWRDEFVKKTTNILLVQLVESTNETAEHSSESDRSNKVIEKELVQECIDGASDNSMVNSAILDAINELKVQGDMLRKEVRDMKPTFVDVVSKKPPSSRKPPSNPKASVNANGSTLPHVNKIETSKRAEKNKATDCSKSCSATNANSALKEGTKISVIKRNILLAGDSILNKVNRKGLRYNVHKHSVPGATIKSLLSDILLFDMSRFDTLVVYIGGNDIANKGDPELIEEHYNQFMATVRASNPKIRILLCKVAPRGDVDVSPLNHIIERLCIHHEAESIDIFRAFHDQNGMVNMRYMTQHDTVHPSISGVKRILGTIDNIVNIVHNFDNAVFVPGNGKSRLNSGSKRSFINLTNTSRNCMKCGETNHDTASCRHRLPITCWWCGHVGHKQDHCWTTR